jgi:hypothetical protein
MDLQPWWYIAAGFFVLGLILLVVWSRSKASSHSERLEQLSGIATLISLFISLASLFLAAVSTVSSGGDNNPPPSTTATSSSPTTTSKAQATTTTKEGYRPLDSDSPKLERRLDMEAVCQDLHRPPYAWLPGQTRNGDINNRRVTGTDQAYKWTCGGPLGEKPAITRDEMSARCAKVYGPGWAAFTADPNDAYKWYCDKI